MITADQAIKQVQAQSPFPKIAQIHGESYANIADVFLKHLPNRGKVLDFGSGMADKLAVLTALGYEGVAFDDLNDQWHRANDNYERIMDFAAKSKIEFRIADGKTLPFQPDEFDGIMLNCILEHLHDSPRSLLCSVLPSLKTGGLLVISVPNACNIRKRMIVPFGKSNYMDFEYYYWHPDPWRGHVREYVRKDLELLCQFLGMELISVHGIHNWATKLRWWLQPAYRTVTRIFPDLRDSWMLVARKPENWKPDAQARSIGDPNGLFTEIRH